MEITSTGTILLIIMAVFLLVALVIGYTEYRTRKLDRESIEESKKYEDSLKKVCDIDETVKIVDFLDRMLNIKFQYYLNSYILPYFVNDKDLDKKEIKKLKEDFYADVSKTLNEGQRDLILKVFSSQGIVLYIHQSFLRLLNDANIRFKQGATGVDAVNQGTLNAIYSE